MNLDTEEKDDRMKFFSANYTITNNNFVIQNLSNEQDSEDLAEICVLKNIIQRGLPSLPSKFLQKRIGLTYKGKKFRNGYPLIDPQGSPEWYKTIKGATDSIDNPARYFYETLLPKHLKKIANKGCRDYGFICQLLLPETPINQITKLDTEEFVKQAVDFYLPQAQLIIEIDGTSHEQTQKSDIARDKHLKKHGCTTIRIQTYDIKNENESFVNKIKDIYNHIDSCLIEQQEKRLGNSNFLDLENYYKKFTTLPSPSDLIILKATATIRFQILILNLLENGTIKMGKKTNIEIIKRDAQAFENDAIEDLNEWFTNIYKLRNKKYKKIKINFNTLNSKESFSNKKNTIKIDFSLFRRYTDEFKSNKDILYVRTDYFDDRDYFKVSSYKPIKYQVSVNKKKDIQAVWYLMWNIFLQVHKNLTLESPSFNEGQMKIISNSLSRNHTIGLLPTGSGKSVCYQLAAILQPAVSFVVTPTVALMEDQKTDLENSYFLRTDFISSYLDADKRESIQKAFSQGKYLFIYISPERFQIESFRTYFQECANNNYIAYAILDEIHCLSEWGHDFRLSYLNLTSTIKKLCPSYEKEDEHHNFKFLGLTATASINVIKDIRIELDIVNDNDIKTPSRYTRPELEFIVRDAGKGDPYSKQIALNNLIETLERDGFFKKPEDLSQTKCGVIFTPHVNGKNGCYEISLNIQSDYNLDTRFYCGQKPSKLAITASQFTEIKKNNQTDFKENKFPLLAATKAFGMGINKPNIFYIIHYGIPQSMESLYQEVGRAGRDLMFSKENTAKGYVLLSQINQNNLVEIYNKFHDEKTYKELMDKFWSPQTSLEELDEICNTKGFKDNDIGLQSFFITGSLKYIYTEVDSINNLFEVFRLPEQKRIEVDPKEFKLDKNTLEHAIYRLKLLGIVEDWTVNFSNNVITVDFLDFNDIKIEKSLISTIEKYSEKFSLKEERQKEYYKSFKDSYPDSTLEHEYIFLLVHWIYDHFVYNRRQSLKTIYESCCHFVDNISNKSEKYLSNKLKRELESYFTHGDYSKDLDSIIGNSTNIASSALKFFFEKTKEVFPKDKFISKKKLADNSMAIKRALESTKNDPTLNLISGITRLKLDQFDNADGKNRLESAFIEIWKLGDIDEIDEIYSFADHLNQKEKDLLSQSLLNSYKKFLKLKEKELPPSQYFDKVKDYTIELSKQLDCQNPKIELLKQANYRLKLITGVYKQ